MKQLHRSKQVVLDQPGLVDEADTTGQSAVPWQPPQILLTDEEQQVLDDLKAFGTLLDDLYPTVGKIRSLAPGLESLLVKLMILAGGLPDGSAYDGTPEHLLPIIDTCIGASDFGTGLGQAFYLASSAFRLAVKNAEPPKGHKNDPQFQQMLAVMQQCLEIEPVTAV